jgi:subtilase family serine protease
MEQAGIVIVNFAHPLTAAHCAQITAQTGTALARVIDIPVQVDVTRPFALQAAALVDAVGLSAAAWQTLPLIINPPGLAPLTAVLLAELHGRLGYFPTILRIRPVNDAIPVQYEVAELLNLQAIREQARQQRVNATSE